MTTPTFPHLPAEGWELYLRDELQGSSLRSVEAHLDDCADCRLALEAADPSRIFRRLRDLPVSESVLDGLCDDVLAEISRGDVQRPVAVPSRGRERLGLLAGVATLVLCVMLVQSGRGPSNGGETAATAPEACTRLALSSDECRDLFQDARFDDEPLLVVPAAADLTELL